MVANPARGELNKENICSLSLFAPENLVSRDSFGCPVPGQPAQFPHYSGLFWCLLTGFHPLSATASNQVYSHQSPSGQSRGYWVTQRRNEGVHCRESLNRRHSASTGCCLFRCTHVILILVRLFVHEYAPPRNYAYSRGVYREEI